MARLLGSSHGEQGHADHQDARPAVAIAERATQQQDRAERQEVGVDHPLQVGPRPLQVMADGLQPDIDHRPVDHRQT
jgi:hypothetical protein